LEGKDVSIILNIPTSDLKHFESRNSQLLELLASTVEKELGVRVVTRTGVPIRRGAEPRLFLLVPLTEKEWAATELGRLCPQISKPMEDLLAQLKLVSTSRIEPKQSLEITEMRSQ
jgi:hypothetical protein